MTTFDNTIAETEGWAIFHTTGTDDEGDWRIERDDEAAVFESDDAAWKHVLDKALSNGSVYHLSALRFIQENNSTEFELLRLKAIELELTNDLSRDLQEQAT